MHCAGRLRILPDSFGYLKSLRLLYLQDNLLTALPPSVGCLGSLHVLDASFNQLETLPSTVPLGLFKLQVRAQGVCEGVCMCVRVCGLGLRAAPKITWDCAFERRAFSACDMCACPTPCDWLLAPQTPPPPSSPTQILKLQVNQLSSFGHALGDGTEPLLDPDACELIGMGTADSREYLEDIERKPLCFKALRVRACVRASPLPSQY